MLKQLEKSKEYKTTKLVLIDRIKDSVGLMTSGFTNIYGEDKDIRGILKSIEFFSNDVFMEIQDINEELEQLRKLKNKEKEKVKGLL